MKRYQFLITFSLLCSLLSAQNTDLHQFKLQINAGISACQVHGDSYNGYSKLGLSTGAMIDYSFSKSWAGQIGLMFIQKGARHNSDPDNGDLTYYNLNLNYVEIPLMLNYRYKRFFFELGHSVGYLAGYKEVTQVGDITGYSPFNNFELSFNLGMGMYFSDDFSLLFRSNNSYLTIRPFQVPSNIYYNNFVARMFNKGLYNNILEIMLQYKIRPFKKSAS